MKRSECYRLAQVAVLEAEALSANEKIDVLKQLIMDEDIAKLIEEKTNETEAAETGKGAE